MMKILSNFFFVLFCVVFNITLFSESVPAKKTQDFSENLLFCLFISFVLEFRFQKLFLSHAHKWVTSDVILKIHFLLLS